MSIAIDFLVSDPVLAHRWMDGLEDWLEGPAVSETAQFLFCDPLKLGELAAHLDALETKPFVVLVMPETENFNACLKKPGFDRVDELLVEPIRPLDLAFLYRRFLTARRALDLAELAGQLSRSVTELREDLMLAEKIQKSRLPTKFPAIKGLTVRSRYLAGMRSGGDYFDVAESEDGAKISLLMSDSSSYGLSSALLTTLMRMTFFISKEGQKSPRETVRMIHQEILRSMKDQDTLSFFFGQIDRKDFRLRYAHYGKIHLFRAKKGEDFMQVEGERSPYLSKERSSWWDHGEKELVLFPEDRLVVCSDGFVGVAGGAEKLLGTLNGYRTKESVDLLNQLAFFAKRSLADDELPGEDCSALALDIDARILRLA